MAGLLATLAIVLSLEQMKRQTQLTLLQLKGGFKHGHLALGSVDWNVSLRYGLCYMIIEVPPKPPRD